MMWFGQSWGAPVCDPSQHVATPIGELCLECDEAIEAEDSGVIMPVTALLKDSVNTDVGMVTETNLVPEHVNCFLRHAIGSVGHQLGKCLCFNPDPATRFDDPPGLTRREAADAAVELFDRQGFVSRPHLER